MQLINTLVAISQPKETVSNLAQLRGGLLCDGSTMRDVDRVTDEIRPQESDPKDEASKNSMSEFLDGPKRGIPKDC